MSETQSTTTPARGLPAGQVLIKGRCQAVRSFQAQTGRVFAFLITLPAPDAYSHPDTVEVTARNRITERDQECAIVCRIGGSRSQFKVTDEKTGEISTVTSAMNRLVAVE